MFEILALAAGLEVVVDSFIRTEQMSVITTVIRITNNTATEVGALNIECAFFDALGKAVDTDTVAVFNLKPGETAYAKSRIKDQSWKIQEAVCRAGAVSP